MPRSDVIAELLLGAVFSLSAVSACAQQATGSGDGTRPKTRPAAVSAPLPRTPAEMPPQPPKVSCDGDRLTITAQNSTLASVLDAIQACTGAEIVVPESAAKERLFAELGPGPVRSVISDLLSSTDFNYVIQASPSDPLKVQTLLLSLRSDDSATGESTTEVATLGNVPPNWRAWLETQQHRAPAAAPVEEESSQTVDAAVQLPDAPADASPTPAPVVATVAAPTPPASPLLAEASAIISTARQPSFPPLQPRTTEQMIAGMLRLYDLRLQIARQQTAVAQRTELALVTVEP